MTTQYRDRFGNIAVSALLAPILLALIFFCYRLVHDDYTQWSANKSLNEFSYLSYQIERETKFIVKLGDEIMETRNLSVRYGEVSRESWITTDALRKACLDLQEAIGDYNIAVQPAYSITMSDPISMQIHQEVNPVAANYCIQYGNWR